MQIIGSSPRLWVTAIIDLLAQRFRRFIPTPVGNGPCRLSECAAAPVHPHACGERRRSNFSQTHNYGSSPRLWGTALPGGRRRIRRRFIPTPVGNGPNVRISDVSTAVHPHACGERRRNPQAERSLYGSSPRLWGTDPNEKDYPTIRRFIPTPVGNGRLQFLCLRHVAVHPHACGERPGYDDNICTVFGSSPRLWGTGNLS